MIMDFSDFYLNCPFFLSEKLEKRFTRIILSSVLSQKRAKTYEIEKINELLKKLGILYQDGCEIVNHVIEYSTIKDSKICITLIEDPETGYSKYIACLYMPSLIGNWIPLPISEEINKKNLSILLADDNPELRIEASDMVQDLIMQMFDREILHAFKEMSLIFKEYNDYTTQIGLKYLQKQEENTDT